MKDFTFRIIVILGAFALGFYLLYPTFADSQNEKEISRKLTEYSAKLRQDNPTLSESEFNKKVNAQKDLFMKADPSILKNREKRIKLGLDLQGGMYLVLEINTSKLLEKLATKPDTLFYRLLKESEEATKKSDENIVSVLAKKVRANQRRMTNYFDFGNITASDNEIESKLRKQEEDAVTRAVEIISKRVNKYGVSEPNIQKQGSRRIVLELPGISNHEEALGLVQKGALLEFKLFVKPQLAVSLLKKIDNMLIGADSAFVKMDTTAFKKLSQDDQVKQFKKEHPLFGIIQSARFGADMVVEEENATLLNSYLERADIKKLLEDAGAQFLLDAKPRVVENKKFLTMYCLNAKPELTGDVVTDAYAQIDPQENKPVVIMQMNSGGADEWARITGANAGERCAIVLDGVVFSAPRIEGKIPGGQSRITGSGSMDEAKVLEIVLKSGALPAPVVEIEDRTVGPSLGADSVSQGFSSAIYGFILVSIFMLIYYRNGGIVAVAGLFFTILTSLGILAAFHGVLTLPGIAGVVLSMGMAVDANVLIYERIREEMAAGKTIKAAIDSGFAMSFSAIFDSNVTTLITGIILYQFGTGAIQGFALTLMIGIGTSLFSALVFSRLIFDYFASKGQMINIG